MKIYYTKIEKSINSCEWTKAIKRVNEQRRDKILRCKNEKDKLRSLIAGLLLRFALEKEGIDYKKAEFGYGKYGKPMLLHYEEKVANADLESTLYYKDTERIKDFHKDIFFSLTHCEHYVACAISDENIGIDLEETNRSLFSSDKEKQFLSMAKRICTEHEYAYFSSLSKEEQIRAYLEIWTRKESLAKADGRGIAIGFEQIEVLDKVGFEEEVAKADSECTLYTRWITRDTCMSVYSENLSEKVYYDCYVDCKELFAMKSSKPSQ